jgi:hypothetical protein
MPQVGKFKCTLLANSGTWSPLEYLVACDATNETVPSKHSRATSKAVPRGILSFRPTTSRYILDPPYCYNVSRANSLRRRTLPQRLREVVRGESVLNNLVQVVPRLYQLLATLSFFNGLSQK